MSVITIPAAVAASVGAQGFGQVRYDAAEVSDSTGAAATRLIGPPRWSMSLQSTSGLDLDTAGAWEAMVLQLRGSINHLAVYDLMRQAPRGTMRGSTTLQSGTAVGATSITITGATASPTLKAGDWLQIGTPGSSPNQLVKVMTDASGSVGGVITCTVEPPLRTAFSGGATVTWDKPVAYFKLGNGAVHWNATPARPGIDGFALDLLEQWL